MSKTLVIWQHDSLGYNRSFLVCVSTMTADKSDTDVFAQAHLPPHCRHAVKVPEKLTEQDYFDLAQIYAQLAWPKQAQECISRINQMSPDSALALKAKRLEDTAIPKHMPTDEAIALNLKALQARQRARDPSLAKKLAQECIEKFPNFEYGYTTLGYLLALESKPNYDSGRLTRQQSAEAYRQALQINP